ncbi:hypothetical protein C8039_19735 [Halogeometricum sp. wsp3]|nr:hypothetical protein C8039_19735 [Halogeometricum sp. wsp3]
METTSSMDQLSTNGLVDVTVNVVDKDGNAVTSGTVILTDSAVEIRSVQTVDGAMAQSASRMCEKACT